MMCFLRIIRKCSKKIDFYKSIIELIGENTDKFSNKTAEAVLFFYSVTHNTFARRATERGVAAKRYGII